MVKNATDFFGGSSKSTRVIEVGNSTMWSELHADYLESIFKRVGVIEYLMCACVCKSWRSVAIDFKQKFMASQGPLVFLMSKHARKHCYFYNMFDKRLYRATLPHLAGNKCLGFTCGYLVLRDSERTKKKANIWLVNPFTMHELEFPDPPNHYSHVILASLANSDQDFVVVAFSRFSPYLQFCRSGDVNWNVFGYVEKPWMLIDVAVFKGKIYVLSSYGELWTLNLNSDPTLTMLPVKSVDACPCHLLLVASHEELYIAHFHPALYFIKIHKLDFERMEWEEVILQGELLFLSELKCCGLSFPTPSWGCSREQMNQVLYLRDDPKGEISGHHTVLYISRRLKWQMLAIPKDWKPPKIFIRSPIWYFPHLSSTVDSVYED